MICFEALWPQFYAHEGLHYEKQIDASVIVTLPLDGHKR